MNENAINNLNAEIEALNKDIKVLQAEKTALTKELFEAARQAYTSEEWKKVAGLANKLAQNDTSTVFKCGLKNRFNRYLEEGE